MKIKLLQDTVLEDGKHQAGEFVEPADIEVANQLIKTGFAVLVEDEEIVTFVKPKKAKK